MTNNSSEVADAIASDPEPAIVAAPRADSAVASDPGDSTTVAAKLFGLLNDARRTAGIPALRRLERRHHQLSLTAGQVSASSLSVGDAQRCPHASEAPKGPDREHRRVHLAGRTHLSP